MGVTSRSGEMTKREDFDDRLCGNRQIMCTHVSMYVSGPHHLLVGEQEDWVGGKKEKKKEKKEKKKKKRKAPGLLYFITCTEFSPPHNSLVLV